MINLLPLVPALPLVGFVVLSLAGKYLNAKAAAWLATGLVGAAFVLAVGVGLSMPPTGPAAAEVSPTDLRSDPMQANPMLPPIGFPATPLTGVTQVLWRWIDVGEDQVEVTVALKELPAGQPIPADAVGKLWLPLDKTAGLREALPHIWDAQAVVGLKPAAGAVPALSPLTDVDVVPPPDGFKVAAPRQQHRFVVDASLHLDGLSLLMMLIITGVGFLIHLFSVGYMAGDGDIRRYFAYLNLFVFSMLVLVLGGNFLVLFVGWELVGACSYLLIGFWYKEPANAAAGRKAFIVNRVGDFAFLLGLMLLWSVFGSLAYGDVFRQACAMTPGANPYVAAICLLLLIGATGKSAQIPLFVWLPDAMAGPTPVSALIHAATMVTAGVYMIARAHSLYNLAPDVLAAVAVIGGLTALFAALIALVQVDIKRVLAYSTISQLGYMFLGLGAGAYSAAIFHLMTHAFFKALLFLGAGSIMHAMEHGFHEAKSHPTAEDGIPPQQDMRQMGGLLKRLRITGWTFVIGGLALAGIFPLAGFWSKDEILRAVADKGALQPNLWTGLAVLGMMTAFLTACYTGRQMFMVLTGPPRSDGAKHAHESPPAMTIPLIALAVLSAVGGLVGVALMGGEPAVANLLSPVLGAVEDAGGVPVAVMALVATFVAGAGLVLAALMYSPWARLDPARVAGAMPWVYRLFWRKFYVDELYGVLFVRPFKALSVFFWRVVDDGLIDGAVNGVGRAAAGVAQWSRGFQTGYARNYALAMLLGGLFIVLYLVMKGL